MARALRIERPGGRYHVTARGNERKPPYREDRARAHFLKLLGQATKRFGVRVHAYVLMMDNHFHLLRETPEANLSRAMHWLNVSCSMHTEGPLRQGVVERSWDRLVGGLVPGSAAFAKRLVDGVAGHRSEQTPLRRLPRPASRAEIVSAVERFKGQGPATAMLEKETDPEKRWQRLCEVQRELQLRSAAARLRPFPQLGPSPRLPVSASPRLPPLSPPPRKQLGSYLNVL